MVTCSPVATTTSCSRSLGRSFTACTSFSSRFVSPDIAETTTTTSCPAARARRHLRATVRMRSGSATEVPPYFWTHSATLGAPPCPACSRRAGARSLARDLRATLDGEPRVGVPSAAHDGPAIAPGWRDVEPGGDPRGEPRRLPRCARARGALARVERARALVDRIAAGRGAAYGINTGFGTLAEVRIDRKDLRTLQRNLILSHAAGVGTPLPVPEARALLAPPRATCSPRGYSGIRPRTLQLALDMLNRGVIPVVPERGSVGASGDLAPLAHLALVLIGEGEAFVGGERLPGTRGAGAGGARAGGARGQGGPGAGERHPGDVRRGRAGAAPRRGAGRDWPTWPGR